MIVFDSATAPAWRRDPGAGAGEYKDERGQARLYEMSEKALVLWAKE
jgi:hypothetical protein